VGRAPTQRVEAMPPMRWLAAEQVVTFVLGGQLFALPLATVLEIQQVVEFTPLPGADPAVLGLLDVRGVLMPAYDLGRLIGLPAVSRGLETPMLICTLSGGPACFVVEAVRDVIEATAAAARSSSDAGGSAAYVLGTCQVGEGLAVLLDPDRLVPESLTMSLHSTAAPVTAAATQGGDRL